MTTPTNTTVQDNPDESRFEVHVDGELAGFADYQLSSTSLLLTHTEVDDAYEGMGLAGQLAANAFAYAADAGLAVLPRCQYMASYVKRHPELLRLVPEARRAEFGLDQVS